MCPSKASWYKTRGELETAVAELRRQPATIKSVTINEAHGPQKSLAADNRFKKVSSFNPGSVAKRIITQEPTR
jgi:hypothetical protein